MSQSPLSPRSVAADLADLINGSPCHGEVAYSAGCADDRLLVTVTDDRGTTCCFELTVRATALHPAKD